MIHGSYMIFDSDSRRYSLHGLHEIEHLKKTNFANAEITNTRVFRARPVSSMVRMDEIEDSGCGCESVTGASEKANAALVIEWGVMGHFWLAPFAAVCRGEDLHLTTCLHELEMNRKCDLA